MLYHHCDGYPEGIGRDLKQFLHAKKWWFASEIANDLIKQRGIKDDGYEVTTCVHGDEEYIYVIDCDKKTLKCYEHRWDEPYEISISRQEIGIPE